MRTLGVFRPRHPCDYLCIATISETSTTVPSGHVIVPVPVLNCAKTSSYLQSQVIVAPPLVMTLQFLWRWWGLAIGLVVDMDSSWWLLKNFVTSGSPEQLPNAETYTKPQETARNCKKLDRFYVVLSIFLQPDRRPRVCLPCRLLLQNRHGTR